MASINVPKRDMDIQTTAAAIRYALRKHPNADVLRECRRWLPPHWGVVVAKAAEIVAAEAPPAAGVAAGVPLPPSPSASADVAAGVPLPPSPSAAAGVAAGVAPPAADVAAEAPPAAGVAAGVAPPAADVAAGVAPPAADVAAEAPPAAGVAAGVPLPPSPSARMADVSPTGKGSQSRKRRAREESSDSDKSAMLEQVG
jgi:hypothetical protein